MACRVRGEAAGARRPGPGDTPSFLRGEGGSEGACVGGGERADAAGPGASPMHTGPWNRKEHPSLSGSDSEARSSYYPRRKAGSFVGCWGKDFLQGVRKAEVRFTLYRVAWYWELDTSIRGAT